MISFQCSNRYPLDTMAIRAPNLAYKSFHLLHYPLASPLSPSLKALSDDPFLPDNRSAGEDEPIRGFKGDYRGLSCPGEMGFRFSGSNVYCPAFMAREEEKFRKISKPIRFLCWCCGFLERIGALNVNKISG
ncbi:hypothetical protein CEXT_673231 [Caerostris extrusa]|uniref:Uncharacterized protein n=1 Tax=Caerostris extrusa TaxID=172846 RepID=A0AAV4Y8Y1_CAEEX|nr:hypothetical protein CEXT_673231 [Caerostris extrusa]